MHPSLPRAFRWYQEHDWGMHSLGDLNVTNKQTKGIDQWVIKKIQEVTIVLLLYLVSDLPQFNNLGVNHAWMRPFVKVLQYFAKNDTLEYDLWWNNRCILHFYKNLESHLSNTSWPLQQLRVKCPFSIHDTSLGWIFSLNVQKELQNLLIHTSLNNLTSNLVMLLLILNF